MTSPDSPAPKKGLSGLAIAGIGCGVLLLLAIVGAVVIFGFFARKVKDTVGDFQKNPAKAAAVLAVKTNPDLDLVKADDATNEITVRNKKTGEETTLSFDEISKGKFRIKGAQGGEVSVEAAGGTDGGRIVVKGPNGETTIGGLSAATTAPAWVPAYPGAKAQSGGMKMEKADSITGAFTVQTPDVPAKVKAYFEARLKTDGFEIETTSANTDGNDSAVITGRKDDGKRTITVLVNAEKGTTSLVINYEGPKE